MGWVTHGMGPAFADRNVCIAVFSGVENALGIKERLATAGVEAATLNAKMVVDDYHVLVAAHAALRAEQVGRLMSHSLTGELIFSLSPSRGIQKSVDQFGVNEDTSAVVAVLFDAPKDKLNAAAAAIGGEIVNEAELGGFSDRERIVQVYGVLEADLAVGSLTDCCLGKMAVKWARK